MAEVVARQGAVQFTECGGVGLIVEQEGHKYLARGWTLTPEFKATVGLILDHGLTCVIRTKHPSPKHLNTHRGVDYVGFSRSSEERWVIVLDQYSGRPSIDRVTVEKGYRDVLASAEIPFEWETSGGQNIFVEIKYLRELLSILTDETIDAIERERGRLPTTYRRDRSSVIVSEAALQTVLAMGLSEGRFGELFGAVTKVIEHPRWGRNEGGATPYKRDVPDMLLLTRDVMFILELKKGQISAQSVHQMCRYLDNPQAILLAGGRRLQGIVIGYHLSPRLDIGALLKIHASAPIRVLTYLHPTPGDLQLSEVLSSEA
ncbi:hypothetical protein [Microvirga rosea]|uniref:hypothetical protein n=1 Tax=Microvirga rosea TaxID=2715425 RepID=UPI001D0A3F52|nr:hypothetical protein [Microvirga rosea]MCB8819548.1 hypothetical protein [Microvirga rosea]